MHLVSLRARGLIPFPDEVRLDVDQLPRGVVVLAGPNGVGKTTFLEATIPGALFRAIPTRGSLSALATSAESFAEAVVEHAGRRWTIRQEIDGRPGKGQGQSVVLDDAGQPVLQSAGVREFDGWAAKTLPNPDLFLAADFVAQRSAGLIDLTTAQRKTVILAAIGVSKYERLAGLAHALRVEAEGRLSALQTRKLEAARQAAGMDEAAAAETMARAERGAAEQALQEARAALDRARERHAALLEAFRDADRARARRTPLLMQQSDIASRLAGIRQRSEARLRKPMPDPEVIRAAAAALPAAELAMVRSHGAAGEAVERAAKADAALSPLRAEARFLHDALVGAENLDRELEDMRLTQGELEREAATIADLDRQATELAAQVQKAQEHATELRRQQREGLMPRIHGLREVLGTIERLDENHAHVSLAIEHAKLGREEDDERARAIAGLGERIKAADLEVDSLDGRQRQARNAAEHARWAEQRANQRKRDIEAYEHRLAARNQQRTRAAALEHEVADAVAAARAAREAADAARVAAHDAGVELGRLRGLAARAPELERHRAEHEADAAALEQAIRDMEALKAALAEAPEPPIAAPPPGFEIEERSVRMAEGAVQGAIARVGAATAAREAAERAVAREAEVTAEMNGVGEEVSDWSILERALGRDGIQALEIDAAGPELAALANGFLADCYGSRWSVTLATTRPKADGGDREVYDLLVHDAEAPPEKATTEIRWKSGGEAVIVGEAIALALSTFAAARAGSGAGATWVRDESGAALDGEKGEAYVRMLRRAAELAGAHRVLLISHSPAVQAAADARVRFSDGAIAVE